MLAKDIMTKNVLFVKPDTSVIKAIDILLENHISGLPVVDDNMRLAGVVSEKDFLGILLEKNVKLDEKVHRYMSKKVVKFNDEDSIVDICDFFIKNNVRRVPIVSQDKLVGVISRKDILQLILNTVLTLEENPEKK